MGLIGNQTRNSFGVYRTLYTQESRFPGNFSRYTNFCYTRSQSGASAVLVNMATPEGGYPPATFFPQQVAGGMVMRVIGSNINTFDLIPQQPTSMDMTGSGTLAADIIGYGNIICALTGSNTFSADISADGNIVLAATGSGTMTATIQGDGNITVDFSGSGTLTAEASLIKAMLLAMTGSGGLTADATLYALMVAAMTGDGTLTASITGQKDMSVDFTGTGNLSADINAFANVILGLVGSGTLNAGVGAIANMSVDIVVTGSGLTTANVGAAVWAALAAANDTPETMGEKLNNAASAGDPWGTVLPGSYTGEEAGKIVADLEVLIRQVKALTSANL